MFFKNLCLYRLPPGWNIPAAEFEARLRAHGFDRIEITDVGEWLDTRFGGRFACPSGPSKLVTAQVR